MNAENGISRKEGENEVSVVYVTCKCPGHCMSWSFWQKKIILLISKPAATGYAWWADNYYLFTLGAILKELHGDLATWLPFCPAKLRIFYSPLISFLLWGNKWLSHRFLEWEIFSDVGPEKIKICLLDEQTSQPHYSPVLL